MKRGRVIEVHRTNYSVAIDASVLTATVRGNFHADGEFPKVGDYVLVSLLDEEKGVIEEVVDRKTVIQRKAVETDEVQIMAANVDLVCIVMGLDNDFNINRLERYLLLVEQSAIPPLIILNKVDVAPALPEQMVAVESVASEIPIEVVSATTGQNMESLYQYVTPGVTAVLLGSSGAGKSTITNWLLQKELQEVKETRADDNRGRHTTTSRQLFELPNGAYLIDTPGMRELGMAESEIAHEQAVFDRIEQFATECKFRNCDHEKSQGCAVLAALEAGEITYRELENYQKILSERVMSDDKFMSNSERHAVQNKKRSQQKNAALQRQRFSRGLR